MIITIEVDNIKGKIIDNLNMNQLSVLQDICSFEVEGSEYKVTQYATRAKGSFNWDGKRKLFDIQNKTFPIGLLGFITKSLNIAGIEVKVINKRKIIDKSYNFVSANFEMRDYQSQAVLSSVLYGNGIVKSPTGSGKTTIAGRTISAINKSAVFIVHTKDLLYQTIDSFKNIFPNEKIGQIGDSIIDYQPITVATMQTLSILGKLKYQSYKFDEDSDDNKELLVDIDQIKLKAFSEYRNSVSVVMFDEVQRICSITAYAVRFLFDKANYAFGYSASPWRDDGSDLMIEAAFGSRIVDISASELIKKGFLVRPIITIKPLSNNVWSGKTYDQVYKSAIVENTFRNLQVCQDAIEQFGLGRNTLILVTQIKHGEILENMIKSMDVATNITFISGKSGGKKRKQVIQDMRDGNAPIIIASSIADVGLDVPRLQSIIEAGAGKSSVTALQRLGRIMRKFPGKELCYFTTYKDTAPYLSSQIDKKVAIWQTEPEFIINRL